jgi:ArsR family metal-binding transcriptional regulator
MEMLIKEYQIQLVEPGCAVGSGRWGAQAKVPDDMSPVFPYLNAVIKDAQYDPESRVLVWGDQGQRYALHPTRILVARVRDIFEAEEIVAGIAEQVNRTWQGRESITPRYTERKLPSVIELLKLLPRTNCRECGYPTCMAYANDLRSGRISLEQCPPLSQPEYGENREKLLALISLD